MEEIKTAEETTVVNATNEVTEEQLSNLEKMNDFRLKVLRSQVEFDLIYGRPRRDGTRIPPSVRNNNRVLLDALDILQSETPNRATNEYEKRSVASLVEYFNSLILKIIQEKANEQTKEKGENNVNNTNTNEQV